MYTNPHTERKNKLVWLLKNGDENISIIQNFVNLEKQKIQLKYIPELREWFNQQCTKFQAELNQDLDNFMENYKLNLTFLRTYMKSQNYIMEIME
jgi:hypothetical protein